ncbi:Necrosis inducing protein NPP1 [Phytophthora megakarya]|uniref:Necrosis inducing protein NPP1 n=1 Tax=Phytophthora megakarya TaxID=4795 RepID=A0A225VRV5_9STRA|nr:Necrosis inducing protein NPP1 [Phytophthora megakarya]
MRGFVLYAVAILATIRAASIDHDTVQPFPQPEPITIGEKAALKFKPSVAVKTGCHPYPAVNTAGDTNAGLKGTGAFDGKCKGSPLGSQVYSRSTWFEGKWAIMYAWYFPKDMKNIGVVKKGNRHDWENLVVWLDNPALANPTILATSASTHGTAMGDLGYVIHSPPKRSDVINGITPKVRYDEEKWYWTHSISQSDEEGVYQDLIQWNQLTDAAREALENTDFGKDNNVPFNNAFFETNLKSASTNQVYIPRRFGGRTSRSIWE